MLNTEGIPRKVNTIVLTFQVHSEVTRLNSSAGIVCRMTDAGDYERILKEEEVSGEQ